MNITSIVQIERRISAVDGLRAGGGHPASTSTLGQRFGLATYRRLPLYPYKLTSLPCVGMSQMCHQRTTALLFVISPLFYP